MSASEAFTERTWHAMPLYECSSCAFNTLDRSAMIEHQQIEHRVAPVKQPDPVAIVYDRFGVVVAPAATESVVTPIPGVATDVQPVVLNVPKEFWVNPDAPSIVEPPLPEPPTEVGQEKADDAALEKKYGTGSV